MRFLKLKRLPSYFLRFLISYLLVLLLPSVFIYLLFSELLFGEMKTRIEADNELLSYVFEENIRNVMEACDGVVENLSYYQAVAPFSLIRYPSRAIDLKDSLQKYTVTNDVMEEIGVYFWMDRYVYTNKSSYTQENYIAYQGFQEECGQGFLELIGQIEEPCFFKGEKESGGYVLMYVQPYRFRSDLTGAVWFVLDQAELERLMADVPENARRTALFDTSGTLLLGETPEDIGEEKIEELLERAESRGSLVVEEKEYRMEIRTLLECDLLYFQAVPDSQMYARLEETRKKYLLVMCMVTLAGGVISIGLSRRLYRPIRMLKSLIPDGGKAQGDEFSSFESAYTDLKERNEELNRKVRENAEFHQRYLLNCLINGSYLEQEDFRTEAEDCGLNVSSPWWMVLIDSDRKRSREELEAVLKSCVSVSCLYLCIEQEEGRVFMLGMEERPEQEMLFPDEILVSRPADSVFELSVAYVELRILAEKSKGEASGLDSRSLSRYERMIEDFGEFLESGEWDGLTELAGKLDERLRKETTEVRKLVYYRIIRLCQRNPYWQESEQKGDELADRILMAPDREELERLVPNELLLMLQRLKKESRKPLLSIEKVLEYVGDHYADTDFSLKMTADHFGVSVSYISQFFKNACGSKLIDYYTNLRMERAKELMKTDMGLREIMLEVGYFNMSSFIRRFKQLYGMTPGEYRHTLSDREKNQGREI